MITYDFKEQLAKGKDGEAVLDDYFRQWYDIEEVTLEQEKKGIDRIFYPKQKLRNLDWLAGLLTGEGTFSWRKYERGQPYPRISMASVDEDIVEAAKEISGVGCIYQHKRHNSPHQDYFSWVVQTKNDALELMLSLYPMLTTAKREQIEAGTDVDKAECLTSVSPFWLAGLLEGEGCFGAYDRADMQRRAARVQLAMCDKEAVSLVASHYGGNVRKTEQRNNKHSIQWVWAKQSAEARNIMYELYPYLGERRREKIRTISAEWGGLGVTVEMKTDTKTQKTSNIFVETYSKMEKNKPGWGWTCSAALLVYFALPDTIYMVAPKTVRDMIPQWVEKYGQRKVKNRGWTSAGIPVPTSEFAKISEVVLLP